ncbi:MAG: DUF429 domain-containing protein [Balneolales bacterium]|nr:DUF429 domain-containing protein [Balneolales bacterium]
MKLAGIDGCRAGWLAISTGDTFTYRLIKSGAELQTFFEFAERIFIDVPIGLSETEPVRSCDMLLRRVLGSAYSSSVFSPPIRAAFLTTDYKAACDMQQAKTGKRFSKQAWNIMPKIRQVDEILQGDKSLARKVHESHPELLFKKLNRGGDAIPKKKTPEGIEYRLGLMDNAYGKGKDAVTTIFKEIRAAYLKKEVKDDDICDALILAFTATQTQFRPIRTLPLPAETDATGLPMAIHFV